MLPTLKEIQEEKKRRQKLAKQEAKTKGARIFALIMVLVGLFFIYSDFKDIGSGKFSPAKVSSLQEEIMWVGFVSAFFAVMALGDKNPRAVKILIGIPISATMMFLALFAKIFALLLKEIPGKIPVIGKFLGKGFQFLIGFVGFFLLFSGNMNLPMAIFFGVILFEKWLRKLLGKFPKAVFPVDYAKKGFPWFWWFFESKPPKSKDQQKFAKRLEEEGLI